MERIDGLSSQGEFDRRKYRPKRAENVNTNCERSCLALQIQLPPCKENGKDKSLTLLRKNHCRIVAVDMRSVVDARTVAPESANAETCLHRNEHTRHVNAELGLFSTILATPAELLHDEVSGA